MNLVVLEIFQYRTPLNIFSVYTRVLGTQSNSTVFSVVICGDLRS